MTTLPADAPWLNRPALAVLVGALGAGQARYVGGAVRDTLLGIAVKDVDIATPLEPQEVMRRLKAHAIQVIPTGIDHGTVTAIIEGGPVEITTLRHDVSTDGRRATVAFAQDWQDDAARRDFTINALYADPASLEVFDYFGGLDDIAARRVRFIGDARQRIREDHLRILRYFRFQARFGSQPADLESENACAELAATLKGLSRERVGMEMINLLGLPDPAPTVARMAELGVLAEVLPEADVAALSALVAEEERQDVEADALRRLAALIPADVQLAESVASRFRLSGAQKKRLALAAGRILPGTGRGTSEAGGGAQAGSPAPESSRDSDGAPPPASLVPLPQGGGMARALAYRIGRPAALDRLLLTGESVAPLKDWEIPTFPIKGGDVVARGVTVGPEVSRILKSLEDRWISDGFPGFGRTSELLEEILR
ncbi:MAG: CCA tRNA nucleotidyltransferase [Novosphingobium sp.]|nr:CCA tRNA nucleotidyltransferase [Novosphingobium sp.]MBP6554051.1 CCA tRNA nucleotidyltransferase [Novosphingobium sp.]